MAAVGIGWQLWRTGGLRTFVSFHKEFEAEYNITNLLGTDEIFDDSFDVDLFLKKHAQKTAEWQENSKKYYLY